VKVRYSKGTRKRPYVKVLYINDATIRQVVYLVKMPEEQYQPDDNGKNALAYFGPFRTNAGAEIFKGNPGKFATVTEAENAAKRFDL